MIETLLIAPQIAFDVVLAISILAGQTYGGLTFCKIGRFGFSFYITRKPVPVLVPVEPTQDPIS